MTAAGASTSVLQYEASDLAPVPGTALYRLKMVDLDGTSTHSEAVTVTYGGELQAKLTVYPNPSNGQVNLTFHEVPQGEVTLRVMDLNGAVIQEMITDPYQKSNLSLDLSSLPKGYYILNGVYAGGMISQKVLIL